MPNTLDLNLEYSLCYCKEEIILKNKGSDQKKSIANSAGSKDDLGLDTTCLRSHLMEVRMWNDEERSNRPEYRGSEASTKRSGRALSKGYGNV